MKAKVLIVDDHPATRLGLKFLLSNEEDFEVCAEADSTQKALQIVRSLKPDVALVDLVLGPGRSGLEFVQQMHNVIPILVCSYHDEKIFAERALATGARGYIQKGQELDEVAQALRRIMKGEIYLSPQMSQRFLKMIGKGREMPDDGLGSLILKLSNREVDVFQLLGQGFETREIAEKLHLSPKTIAKHCENIMYKLDLNSKTKLLYHAITWAGGKE